VRPPPEYSTLAFEHEHRVEPKTRSELEIPKFDEQQLVPSNQVTTEGRD